MSDEKKYTERDLILAKREAAARMRCAVKHECHFDDPTDGPCAECVERMKKLLPVRVSRPRVVRDPREGDRVTGGQYEWSVIDGHLKFHLCGSGAGWYRADGIEGGEFEPTPARVKMWADLLARPMEEVEDDA